MTLKCFNDMMNFLREQVRRFCRGKMPTIDEVESLVVMLGGMAYNIYCKSTYNEEFFREAAARFIRNEMLRVCV